MFAFSIILIFVYQFCLYNSVSFQI